MEGTMIKIALATVLFSFVLYEFFVRERVITACIRSKAEGGAGVFARISLAALVFTCSWVLMNSIFIEAIPASRVIQPNADWLVLAFALTFGWLAWARSKRAPGELLASALRAIVIVGGFAFVISAISGPLLFPSKINQGVLVGLFLIAPAFALLGGVGGLLDWSIRGKPASCRQ